MNKEEILAKLYSLKTFIASHYFLEISHRAAITFCYNCLVDSWNSVDCYENKMIKTTLSIAKSNIKLLWYEKIEPREAQSKCLKQIVSAFNSLWEV